jgi:CRP/FNR family transcriptional regulator, cyclic AMP receptor protein
MTLSFVKSLSDSARADLQAIGRSRHFARGSVLFREEDDGSQVMLLEAGSVKVSVAARSGREVIVDVLEPGSLLGEMSAIDGGIRSATVTALTDVDVLVVAQHDFFGFLEQHGEAATVLLGLLVAKLRDATQRQLQLGTADSLARLSRALLELADRYGETEAAGVCRFELPMTQQELASYVGVSREAIVKALATLRSLDWIRTSGRVVEVLDRPALVARSEAW